MDSSKPNQLSDEEESSKSEQGMKVPEITAEGSKSPTKTESGASSKDPMVISNSKNDGNDASNNGSRILPQLPPVISSNPKDFSDISERDESHEKDPITREFEEKEERDRKIESLREDMDDVPSGVLLENIQLPMYGDPYDDDDDIGGDEDHDDDIDAHLLDLNLNVDQQNHRLNLNKVLEIEAERKKLGDGPSISQDVRIVIEKGFGGSSIFAYPKHVGYMKPPHEEMLNFLGSSLASEDPAGCIIAHAPLYEKTFVLTNFIYGCFQQNVEAKALVIVPKSMIGFWMREFKMWLEDHEDDVFLYTISKVEESPESRKMDILLTWTGFQSVLFLGHQDFLTLIADRDVDDSNMYITRTPWIVVLDEGNCPRSETRSVLDAMALVETPRKVILTDTLYENSVKDVFELVNIVRPKLLENSGLSMELANEAKARSEGRVVSSPRFDALDAMLRVPDPTVRARFVLYMKRLMQGVIFCHKGENYVTELPELFDFTVCLNPSPFQRQAVHSAEMLHTNDPKKSAILNTIGVHPKLAATIGEMRENYAVKDEDIDRILENIDIDVGLKAKFFMQLVNFCEMNNEKLVVFSLNSTPLIFLQRLVAKTKGWVEGKHTFCVKRSTNWDPKKCMEGFNTSPEAKIFFGLAKACTEDMLLVTASRVLLLDLYGHPYRALSAIRTVHRPQQTQKVYAYRLMMAFNPEFNQMVMAFQREMNKILWFMRTEEMNTVFYQPENCGDAFLEGLPMTDDIHHLFRREGYAPV